MALLISKEWRNGENKLYLKKEIYDVYSTFIREINNKLYQAIKSEKRSATEVNTFVTNLNNDIDLYLALINDNSSIWDNYSNECKEYIKTLNYLELKQFRPLALAILKNFEKNEIKKTLK